MLLEPFLALGVQLVAAVVEFLTLANLLEVVSELVVGDNERIGCNSCKLQAIGVIVIRCRGGYQNLLLNQVNQEVGVVWNSRWVGAYVDA